METDEKIRIQRRRSFDDPPKEYWVIIETVDDAGHTIQWDGIYASEESARAAIAKAVQ